MRNSNPPSVIKESRTCQAYIANLQPRFARRLCAGTDPAKNCVTHPDAAVPELAGVGLK